MYWELSCLVYTGLSGRSSTRSPRWGLSSCTPPASPARGRSVRAGWLATGPPCCGGPPGHCCYSSTRHTVSAVLCEHQPGSYCDTQHYTHNMVSLSHWPTPLHSHYHHNQHHQHHQHHNQHQFSRHDEQLWAVAPPRLCGSAGVWLVLSPRLRSSR